MDIGKVAATPELLSSFLEGLTFEPWRQLTGEASSIAISSVKSSQVLVLKGEHMARLAYPLNDTYKRGGKVRATFAINTKTAVTLLKIENAIKDRIVSSGMMKKMDMKMMFESSIAAPSQKYPSHTASYDLRVEAPKTSLYRMIENPTDSGWSTVPEEYTEIQKFSAMSLRVAPTLVWKGNGKCALKMQLKQAVVAYEENLPSPVDEVSARDGCQIACDTWKRTWFVMPMDNLLTSKSLIVWPRKWRDLDNVDTMHLGYFAIYC